MNRWLGMNLISEPRIVACLNLRVIVSGFCMKEPDAEMTSERGMSISAFIPRTRKVDPAKATCFNGRQMKAQSPRPNSHIAGKIIGKAGGIFSRPELNRITIVPKPNPPSHTAGKPTLNQVVARDESCVIFFWPTFSGQPQKEASAPRGWLQSRVGFFFIGRLVSMKQRRQSKLLFSTSECRGRTKSSLEGVGILRPCPGASIS